MSSEKLNTIQAAAYISMSVSWLSKTRLDGTGPAYLKIGGAVRYLPSDLDAWLESTRRTAVYDFANDTARARSAA